jgi:hypothetical protein
MSTFSQSLCYGNVRQYLIYILISRNELTYFYWKSLILTKLDKVLEKEDTEKHQSKFSALHSTCSQQAKTKRPTNQSKFEIFQLIFHF